MEPNTSTLPGEPPTKKGLIGFIFGLVGLVIPLLGLVAIVLGILGLTSRNKDARNQVTVFSWLAISLGVIGTLVTFCCLGLMLPALAKARQKAREVIAERDAKAADERAVRERELEAQRAQAKGAKPAPVKP